MARPPHLPARCLPSLPFHSSLLSYSHWKKMFCVELASSHSPWNSLNSCLCLLTMAASAVSTLLYHALSPVQAPHDILSVLMVFKVQFQYCLGHMPFQFIVQQRKRPRFRKLRFDLWLAVSGTLRGWRDGSGLKSTGCSCRGPSTHDSRGHL